MKLGNALMGGLLADEDLLKKAASQGLMGVVPFAKMRQDEAEEQRQKILAEAAAQSAGTQQGMKNGGMTASARADGIAQRGKTKGRMV